MAKKRRRRRRRKKLRLNFGKVAAFLLFCLLCIFGLVMLISTTISHKKEYFNMGLKSYEDEKYDEALAYFDQALLEKELLSKKQDMNLHLYIADIYMKTGEYLKAVGEYDKVLEYSAAKKDDVGKMQSLAQALYDFHQGNYAGAIPALEEAAKGDYPEMYMFLGACYGQIGDVDNMFANYEIYVKKFDYNSYIYAQYASYYLSVDELDQAYGYIYNGLKSDEEYNAELRLLEIAYYEKLKDFDQAFLLAEELVSYYPDFEEGQKEYAFLYTRVSHE